MTGTDDQHINIQLMLEQLNDKGRSLLEYAKDHPEIFIISAIAIAGGVAIITIPLAVGFGPAGVVAGSAAAAWQASIGSVASGSLFAMLQSLTMSGTLLTIGGAAILGGALDLLAESGFMKQLSQVAKETDWNNVKKGMLDWLKEKEWAEKVNKSLEIVGKEFEEKARKTIEDMKDGCTELGKEAEKSARKGGEQIEKNAGDAGENIGSELDDAGKEIQKTAEEVGKQMEEGGGKALENMGRGLDDVGKGIQDAFGG